MDAALKGKTKSSPRSKFSDKDLSASRLSTLNPNKHDREAGGGVSMTGQGRRPVTTLGSCLIHLLVRGLWESMEHTYLEPSYPGRMGLGDLYDHSHQMVAQAAQPESGKVRN